MHEVQVRLNNEMGRLEELHLKEFQLWAKMKSLSEEAVVANKRKIENLTKALDESQVRATLMTDRIRTILQDNHEKFNTRLKVAMDKGWATQAAELHTYCADRENRRKDGKGFYKLSEDNIATIREDLAEDYQALANQHSEELTQLMEEFTESQEETFRQLMDMGSETQRAEELKKAEAIIVPNSHSAEQTDSPPNDRPEVMTMVSCGFSHTI